MGSSSDSTKSSNSSSSSEKEESSEDEYVLPKFDKKFNYDKNAVKFSKNYRQVTVTQSSLFKGLITKKPVKKYAIKFLNDNSYFNIGKQNNKNN
jgi:hypothetical protein